MRSESAIVRVGRILDLLPLLSQGEMRLVDVARLLEVDVEILRQDLELAFLCGLPGYTPDLLIDVHLGEEHVSVIDAQGLDQPRRVGGEEVALILLGLDALEVFLAQSPSGMKSIASLRSKLSVPDRSEYESQKDESSGLWQMVETAILQGREILFDYVDTLGKETTDRRIVPIRIRFKRGQPVLEGFDLVKDENRIFFLSSISRCRLGEVSSIVPPEPADESLSAKVCTVTMKSLPRWWIRRNATFIRDTQERTTELRVELEYWSSEWLLRALLPLTDQIIHIEDPTFPENALRQSLFSHFSGTSAPIDG